MTIAWNFALPTGLPAVASPQNATPHAVSAAAWQKNLQAAGSLLSGVLPQWNETINVKVSLVAGGGNDTGRAGGAPTATTLLGQFVRGGELFSVFEPADIAQARSGGVAGINLTLDSTFLNASVSVDESAGLAGKTASGEVDFVSLAAHELIHGLGFSGYRSLAPATFGTLPADGRISSFDALTEPLKGLPASGPLTFHGKRADAFFGAPVPLTSVLPANPTQHQRDTLKQEAFYHVANFRDGLALDGDPMNGLEFTPGHRTTVRDLALDAAMLNDMFHLKDDQRNLVIVADATDANDLAVDVADFKALTAQVLQEDPFSTVDVITWNAGNAPPQESGFTNDQAEAMKALSAIKLSGRKGPIPPGAFNQLVALVRKGLTWSNKLTPHVATEIAFDDMGPVTIPAS